MIDALDVAGGGYTREGEDVSSECDSYSSGCSSRCAQGELFETLPSDEAQPCSRCGKGIVTQHFTAGHVESEFVGGHGECWDCSERERKAKRRLRKEQADGSD